MSDETKATRSAPSRQGGMDAGSQALAEALRSSFAIVKVVMVVLVVVFLFSGFFTVGPQEKAIILRFGKPLGEGEKALLGAGAHWAFPYPIDEVVKVPITEIQQVKSTVGWFAQTPEQEALNQEPPAGPSLNPMIDGYALTADGNIVHVKATLSYRIENPVRYVFDFVIASNAVQNALDNALLATAARFKVDDILTRDRIGFQDAVRRRVTQLIEAQQLGIIVELCAVDPRPPRQLKQAFDNVVTAGQNRDKVLTDARSDENKVLNKSGADAAGRLNVAETDRTRLIQSITSDAENFRHLLPKYKSNPDLFVQQRLVETMGRVLTNVQDKIFLADRADGKPRELRLLLNRELPKPKTEAKP
ncbi:MAG: protease modulator HflK [Verrucomicrobiota bacterium]